MAFTLGNRSKTVYDTLHPDLQLVIDAALEFGTTDFSLTEGHRPVEKQFGYYKKGRVQNNDGTWIVENKKKVITNVDGFNIKGKHNYEPSLAFDFCVFVPDKVELSWDKNHLSYIAASFMMAAKFLFDTGEIKHEVRWGADWDRDGDMTDHRLVDMPHIELIIP